MNWSRETLGSVCIPTSWRDPRLQPDSVFEYIDISGVDRVSKEVREIRSILGSQAPSRARKEVATGDTLVSTVRPNLNAVAMVPESLNGGVASTGFCVLRADVERILPKFLFYFTLSMSFINSLCSKVRGANYPAVTDVDVREVPLRLPSRPEQRRIVEILDKADRLRKLRHEAAFKAERILPALFLELFGDPIGNPKGWDTVPFGRAGVLERGVSRHRPRNDPSLLGGPYPLIQTSEITNSVGRVYSYTPTYSEEGLRQSRLWPAGTLCITIAANIAHTGILEFDACFPDSVVGFIPHDPGTAEFVQAWLGFLQPAIEAKAPGFAQKNINLALLRDLTIILPPLELRLRFSEQARTLQFQSRQRTRATTLLSDLFTALLDRAFSGDLTASWRAAHMNELLQEVEHQANALAGLEGPR